MPVANHPSAAIRKHEFRGRDQKRLEFRLDRLGAQPTRAGSQNFCERIVDRPFLSKGDNSILGHGVTLLLGGSGGLITNPVTPPSSHRHPVSRIALLEAVVTSKRDKAAAVKLLKRIMKKCGRPQSIVTDRLRAYSAVIKEISARDRHEVGARLNNGAENSHQQFRRRERAMQRVRSMKRLEKFSSVHA